LTISFSGTPVIIEVITSCACSSVSSNCLFASVSFTPFSLRVSFCFTAVCFAYCAATHSTFCSSDNCSPFTVWVGMVLPIACTCDILFIKLLYFFSSILPFAFDSSIASRYCCGAFVMSNSVAFVLVPIQL